MRVHPSMSAAGCLPLLFALSMSARAEPPAEPQKTGCGALGDVARFQSFHDNYVLWHQMRNNGWAAKDEGALRGQVSVQYSLINCPQQRDKESRTPKRLVATARSDKPDFWERLAGTEVFVSYTNRFDFYLGSRDSGPVINRVSNPGLHLRLPAGVISGQPGDGRDSLQLSLEHMSDGQVVEPVTNPRDQLRAQRAYERGDRPFFDTISRGMNYVALQGEWIWDLPQKSEAQLDLRAKVKAYIGQSDSAITWGPLAGQGLRFANYERAKVRLGLYWPELGRFELTSQFGDSGFKHASYTVSWQYNLRVDRVNFELPLFVQAHFGPMNTLSNYTQRQDSIGIGLRLAY